jgi:hypothetical protein
MPVIVDVLVVLVIIGVAYWLISPMLNRQRTGSSITPSAGGHPSEVESAEAYRNHLAMARWIELQLKDDLVRSSVAADEEERARRLLKDFYGDER